MTHQATKEQVYTKMQELDAVLQTAVNIRAELWSAIATLSGTETLTPIEFPLKFYENGHIITWGEDSEHFTPATFELIRQLWLAPSRFLSKEDIRQQVIDDDTATDNAVWLRLKNVRKELCNAEFPYSIETVRTRGYQLTAIQEPV